MIKGACHCGNIEYRLKWPPDQPVVPVRACDCSFCRKHGAAWTSNPEAELRICLRDPGKIAPYRFGTNTADFHVCSRCGVVPFVSCEYDGRMYAVVNVNTFHDAEGVSMARSTASFGSEDAADRLDRRKRNWISDVAMTYRYG